jgi:hypothetical protein
MESFHLLTTLLFPGPALEGTWEMLEVKWEVGGSWGRSSSITTMALPNGPGSRNSQENRIHGVAETQGSVPRPALSSEKLEL